MSELTALVTWLPQQNFLFKFTELPKPCAEQRHIMLVFVIVTDDYNIKANKIDCLMGWRIAIDELKSIHQFIDHDISLTVIPDNLENILAMSQAQINVTVITPLRFEQTVEQILYHFTSTIHDESRIKENILFLQE